MSDNTSSGLMTPPPSAERPEADVVCHDGEVSNTQNNIQEMARPVSRKASKWSVKSTPAVGPKPKHALSPFIQRAVQKILKRVNIADKALKRMQSKPWQQKKFLRRIMQGVTPNTPLPPSVEGAYYRKCIELKRRINEIEESNDAARLRKVRIDRAVLKLRLERAFLLEQLRKRMEHNEDDSDRSESPPPTPTEKPLRMKRGQRKGSPAAGSAAPNNPPALQASPSSQAAFAANTQEQSNSQDTPNTHTGTLSAGQQQGLHDHHTVKPSTKSANGSAILPPGSSDDAAAISPGHQLPSQPHAMTTIENGRTGTSEPNGIVDHDQDTEMGEAAGGFGSFRAVNR